MEDLPAFVVQHILWYSDAQSLVSLLSTSKLLAKAAAEDNLWRNLCKKDYSENRMLPGTTTFLQSYKMPLVFVSELKLRHRDSRHLKKLNVLHESGEVILFSYGPHIAADTFFVRKPLIAKVSDVHSERKQPDFTRLCRIMRHPFFVEVFYLDNASRYSHALVREFVARCDCVESIKRNTSAVASFYGAQIVLALEHLENWGLLGTIHGLFNHNRLLVGPDHYLKIYWFSATLTDHKYMNVVPDSGYYMAPELLTGAALGGESTLFWEFGIFLYEVFTGRAPFEGESVAATFMSILEDKPYLPPISRVNPHAANLISHLLEKSPSKRLTNVALMKVHPFFQDISWNDLLAKKFPMHSLVWVGEEGREEGTGGGDGRRGREEGTGGGVEEVGKVGRRNRGSHYVKREGGGVERGAEKIKRGLTT